MEAELTTREHTLATRVDLDRGLHELELKIEAFRGEFRAEMQSIRAELKSDIRDTVRWNFAFWVAQLAAMAAILKLVR